MRLHRGLFAVSVAAVLCIALSAAASERGGYRIVWDDFQNGFSVNTPTGKWFNFTQDTFVADDGIVTTSKRGLTVVSSGINPATHKPAFTKTMGQETGALSAFDHVKWLVVMNHFSSQGLLGFDAEPGKELSCEATISGQIHGTHRHPFGPAVIDADSDPRLGATAISAFDPDTFMIFNFLVTNKMIYAFYERPPFARGVYGNYAAFTFAVPVYERRPSEQHDLKISYDKSGGKVRWFVDGDEVFRVDAIGTRIERRYMLLDRGGFDTIVSPKQLDCGMGTFTFLDGFGRTNRGLVQIDGQNDSYFHPLLGEPAPISFIDPDSLAQNRLFGAGATLNVRRFVVSSLPVRRFGPSQH